MTAPTVIIGAGFSGLAAAVKLAKAGHKVHLLDATSHGGGRARSFLDATTEREIDNGQHLMMGCYHETLDFLQTIGTRELLHENLGLQTVMLRDHGQSPVSLTCPRLPAPLHLAVGIGRMRGMGIWHRATALRAGLLLRQEIARPDDNETCDAWLRRMGQTQAMRNAFWEPLIWGTLNDDPLIASASMLLAVLDRAFLGARSDSNFIVAKVGLSRLYVEPALCYLRERGATIDMGQSVKTIELHDGRICSVRLRSGETLACNRLISAIPPHALLQLLPPELENSQAFRKVAQLRTSPIVNLWATLDRPLVPDPMFTGLIDSPLHWVFNRELVEGTGEKRRPLTSWTISGARSSVGESPAMLQQMLERELQRFYPKNPPRVVAFRAIKEKRATISHAAGSYLLRPEIRSEVPGLYLAGDWVRTGLPATIESAVLSGHRAAGYVLAN